MRNNVFIVLRGPAGSGKSTVAHLLKKTLKEKTVVIEQDYFNHTLFKGMVDDKGLIPEIIEMVSLIILSNGYNVVLEGVLRKEKYQRVIENIAQRFNGQSVVCYFDVSKEETVRRHETRDKRKEFDSDEMLSWYDLASPLEINGEVVIDEKLFKEDIVYRITKHLVGRD